MLHLTTTPELASDLVLIRPNCRLQGVFGARKTCGKPVGQALKVEQQRALNCESFAAPNSAPKPPLNNRGQLARFRQVFHGMFDTIHGNLELINPVAAIVYNIPTPGCPRGTPPLKITKSLTLKGLVNKATPLLNPTNP